jgi:hypothetical protein
MSSISRKLRNCVIRRAKNRCEYCGLSQEGQEATFHIDHIIPVSVGGESVLDNLALACVSCSLRKAAREKAVDPVSGDEVPIYNPVKDIWDDHFYWDVFYIVGLTAIGRATVDALQMNRSLIIAIRREEFRLGRHP